MKIAFTSCFDVLDDNEQKVWRKVAEEDPDALVLLGDTIYMDFGLPGFSDHPLGKPRKWNDQKFADEMYRRYKLQSEVAFFREFVTSVQHIGVTWDDHDFAWNNTSGKGNSNSKKVVPRNKKLIAKALHLQFKDWIRTRPLPDAYPAQPTMQELLGTQDNGIEESFDIGGVRFLMTDGRYYREEKAVGSDPFDIHGGDDDEELTSMLGAEQKGWLKAKINEWQGICVVCSGSTLTGRSEAWEQYNDLEWLSDQNFQRTIVLSGDIHKIASQKHKELDGLWEFVASGAARPGFGGDTGNFGIANVGDDEIDVALYDEDGLDKKKKIRFS